MNIEAAREVIQVKIDKLWESLVPFLAVILLLSSVPALHSWVYELNGLKDWKAMMMYLAGIYSFMHHRHFFHTLMVDVVKAMGPVLVLIVACTIYGYKSSTYDLISTVAWNAVAILRKICIVLFPWIFITTSIAVGGVGANRILNYMCRRQRHSSCKILDETLRSNALTVLKAWAKHKTPNSTIVPGTRRFSQDCEAIGVTPNQMHAAHMYIFMQGFAVPEGAVTRSRAKKKPAAYNFRVKTVKTCIQQIELNIPRGD